MKKLMQLKKFIIANFLIVNYVIFAFLGKFFITNPLDRRKFFIKHVSRQSKILLKIIDINLTLENAHNFKAEKNYLILANHLSYLDVLLLSATKPSCFITSVEIKNTPGLGLLTELGGCLYVERRDKSNISNEIKEITDALRDGLNVVIFPEATSTNGSSVLPFKRSLLTAAIEAEKNILPITIQYSSINDTKVTSENRDYLCWYDDMDFLPHLYALMSKEKINISLKISEEIPVDKNSARDFLAEKAYASIVASYQPLI